MRRGGMGHRKVRSPANLRGVSGVARSLGCSSCNHGELFLQNTEHIYKFRNWWHHRLSHRDIDRFSYDLSSSAIFISAAAATTIGFLRDIRFSVFPHPFCPSLLPAPALSFCLNCLGSVTSLVTLLTPFVGKFTHNIFLSQYIYDRGQILDRN